MKKLLFILIAFIGILSSCEKEKFIDVEEEVLIGEYMLDGISREAGMHWCNPSGDAVYCHGITQEGRGCHNKTTNINGYCYLHGGQDNGTYNYPVTTININTREGVLNFLRTTKDREIMECLKYEFYYRDFSDFKIYLQNNVIYGATKCLITNDITWTHDKLPVELCQYNNGQEGYVLFNEIGDEYYLIYFMDGENSTIDKEFKTDKYSMPVYSYKRLAADDCIFNFTLYFTRK